MRGAGCNASPGLSARPGAKDAPPLLDLAEATFRHGGAAMMRKLLFATTLLGALALAAPYALAEGCGKGAVVGGVLGHETGSGHAVAGSAAGCAVGHHEAKKADKKAAAQQQQSAGNNNGSSGSSTPNNGASNSGSANSGGNAPPKQ
jgi:hypothetical protein